MKPENEAELAEMVAGAEGPLSVRGGATRGMCPEGEELDVTGLSGIGLYEPGALTMVVGAGTPLDEVERELAAQNQRLAFEPMDHRGLLGTTGQPTIGGVVAGNISGPRRIQVGALRDHLLGVRFVDGRGQVVRNGGRVMKNVTGYDLVKLLAGSWGTLGVLSEVSLKVLPMAETQATVTVRVDDAAAAVRAMSAALGSPYEVTGAAYDPARGVALLRLEGFAGSVAYRTGRLAALLAPFGEVAHDADPVKSGEIWRGIRDVAAFHGRAGDVWRISVKPTDAPDLARRLGAEGLLFDWGGGLVWALVAAGSDLRARAGRFDGHATLVRADAATKARLGIFQPLSPPLEAISAGLRARFDPRAILNRGLMRPAAAG